MARIATLARSPSSETTLLSSCRRSVVRAGLVATRVRRLPDSAPVPKIEELFQLLAQVTDPTVE